MDSACGDSLSIQSVENESEMMTDMKGIERHCDVNPNTSQSAESDLEFDESITEDSGESEMNQDEEDLLDESNLDSSYLRDMRMDPARKDEARMRNGCGVRSTSLSTAWTPSMNLLELAYKLKQTEFRVFGRYDESKSSSNDYLADYNHYAYTPDHYSAKPVNHHTSDPYSTKPANSSTNAHMSSNEVYRKDYQNFDRNGLNGNSLPETSKCDRMMNSFSTPRFASQNVDARKSDVDDYNVDLNSGLSATQTVVDDEMRGGGRTTGFQSYPDDLKADMEDQSSVASQNASSGGPRQDVSASRYSMSAFDVRRRHHCRFCDYRTDSTSHLRRHEISIHYNGRAPRKRNPACPPENVSPVSAVLPPSVVVSGYNFSDVRRHRCELCEYQTDSLSHLKRHLGSVHGKDKPFRCNICLSEFARSEKVKDHFASHHPGVSFDLKALRIIPAKPAAARGVTPKASPSKPAAAVSASSIVKSEPEECLESSAVAEPVDEIDNDLVELVNAAVAAKGEGAKPFACLQCPYAARDVWHLRRHIGDVHLKRRNHRCKVCKYATGRQDRLVAHMRIHGEMFCLYCDYSSADINSYRQHLQTCANNRGATGSTMWGDMLFGDLSGNEELSEQERTCRICNLVFPSLGDHRAHIDAQHVGRCTDGSLMCKQCSSYISPPGIAMHDMMHAHVITHTVQSFICPTPGCEFRSTYSRTLLLHQKFYHDMTGGGEADGEGGVPGDSGEASGAGQFATNSSPLTLNPSTPPLSGTPGVGLFACPICVDRPPFKYRRSYEKHMSQHSATCGCPLCSESFVTQAELQAHIMYSHSKPE